MRDGNQWKKPPFMSLTHPYAAGALLSTTGDIYIWAKALSEGEFISNTTFLRSLEPITTKGGEAGAYGLGWFISNFQGTMAYSHGGGSAGFSSEIILVPEFSTFVVVLSNNSTVQPGPNYVARRLAALAIDRPYENLKEIILPAEILQSYSGTYLFSSGQEVTIEPREGRLVFLTQGAPPIVLFAESQDTFFMTAIEAKVQFEISPDGIVKHFVFLQGGREIIAEGNR